MMMSGLRRSLLAGAALASLVVPATIVRADGGDNAARSLAERFAAPAAKSRLPAGVRVVEPAPTPSEADERRMIEEIDMLARARAEAEARREALVQAREAAERAEQSAAAAPSRQANENAKEAARAAREAAEVSRLAEARRKAEEARQAATAAQKAAEERQLAETRRREAEQARMAAMAAEREAEAARIADALRRGRLARQSATAASDATERPEAPARVTNNLGRPPAAEDIEPRAEDRWWLKDEPARPGVGQAALPPAPPGDDALRQAIRVAVLLVMNPGNRGIRRRNKTADPLLCGEFGCYVSNGANESARLMSRRKAFGIGRTLGSRAGACRNSLGCVFRDINLVSYPAMLQPVDMRVFRHDKRQTQLLREASRCRLAAKQIRCVAYRGPDYTMWVVPEALAERVGGDALERAVADGLPEAAHAEWHPRQLQ